MPLAHRSAMNAAQLAQACCDAYLAGDLDSVVRLTTARVALAAPATTAQSDKTVAPRKAA